MRCRLVRAATGGIRGPPDPLRNPCKRPAYRPTPHTMQAFRSRSVVPPMTRLWVATHHEEAADVEEGVPGSRGGSATCPGSPRHQQREESVMLRSLSKSLLLRGLLAIVVGIIALAWPGVTVGAVVAIFAIAVFFDAVGQGMRAFSSEKAGPVAGHLLLALLDIAAGVVALAWPDITALALTIWIGAGAVVIGIGE